MGNTYNAFNGPRCAEIYNPAMPIGSRWSGLLADSLFDRLYHSGSWLTTNGDVRRPLLCAKPCLRN